MCIRDSQLPDYVKGLLPAYGTVQRLLCLSTGECLYTTWKLVYLRHGMPPYDLLNALKYDRIEAILPQYEENMPPYGPLYDFFISYTGNCLYTNTEVL